ASGYSTPRWRLIETAPLRLEQPRRMPISLTHAASCYRRTSRGSILRTSFVVWTPSWEARMADKIRAATLVAPKEFELREYDRPEIASDAALLKVEAVGICGSDVGSYQRDVTTPRIMGHENVGIIAEIGREASQNW